jgi:glycosyltransferase involved in cell wall biosynthesis
MRRVDLFVAMENPNALLGLLLRRIGITKRVAYCLLDFMPKRFANPLMNGIFHGLDRLSERFCDFSWNVSPNLMRARRRYGQASAEATQLIVPVASPEPDESLLGVRTKKKHVLYLGLLYPMFGVDVLVRAFRNVLREVPDAILDIVGDGVLRGELERYVAQTGMSGKVLLHGMLSDSEADKIVASSRAGLAPYVIESANSQFMYMDTSKGKLYLTYGVPIIITQYASTAALIGEREAGLVVPCTEVDLAAAILKVILDDGLFERMHKNALALGEELRPQSVFREPFRLGLA